MFSKRIIGTAAAVTTALAIFSSPVLAEDWIKAMERHDAAAAANKAEARSDGQWGFTLSAVINDAEWRQKTAAALRKQPRPSVTAQTQRYRQLVEKTEPRYLSPF